MLVAVNTAKHAVFVELGDDRQVVAAFPKSLNGSLRDERSKTSCLNGWLMPPRMLALWRDGHNNVWPHLSLGNRTPA